MRWPFRDKIETKVFRLQKLMGKKIEYFETRFFVSRNQFSYSGKWPRLGPIMGQTSNRTFLAHKHGSLLQGPQSRFFHIKPKNIKNPPIALSLTHCVSKYTNNYHNYCTQKRDPN